MMGFLWLILVLELTVVHGFLLEESTPGLSDCISEIQSIKTVVISIKENFENEMRGIKSENLNLKITNDKLEQDLKNVTEILTATTTELHTLKQQLQDGIQDIKSIEMSVKENFENEISVLRSKNTNLKNQNDMLEQDLKNVTEILTATTTELHTLKQQLQDENTNLKNQNDKLEQDLKNVTYILTATTIEIHTLKQQLKDEKTNLTNHNDKLEQDLKNISEILTTTTTELSTLKQQLKDQTLEIMAQQTKTETLQQQITTVTNSSYIIHRQEFLDLYNQTLTIQSIVLSTNRQLEKLSSYYNLTVKEINDKLEVTARGTTYVRWSRKQCPNQADLVYSGFAGGGKDDERGSSAEPVCLPPDPDFNQTTGYDHGRMYGAEFPNNFFAPDSNSQDVPCAVCRSRHTSSTIMIPGKSSCYDGWREEYHGYLASNYYNSVSAGSYVCIDIQPEYVDGGSSWNNYSKLFNNVLAKCGSLRCPPYKHDHPLTCVVCSR